MSFGESTSSLVEDKLKTISLSFRKLIALNKDVTEAILM